MSAVDIKRKSNTLMISLFVILLILLVLIAALLYMNLKKEDTITYVYENNTLINNLNSSNVEPEISSEHLNYLLLNLNADELGGLFFGNPRIKFVVGDKTFISEIIDGEIITSIGDSDEVDITLYMDQETMIGILESDDIIDEMSRGIDNGDITLEINEDYPTLYGKGYKGLYEDLTGEEINLSPVSNIHWSFTLIILIALVIVVLYFIRKNIK